MPIRPIIPPILKPTIDPIVDGGGLPWDRRDGGGGAWTPAALGSALKLDLAPENYSTGAAGWTDPVRGLSYTQATSGKRPGTRTVNGITVPDFVAASSQGLIGPSIQTIAGANASFMIHAVFVADILEPDDSLWLVPPLFRTYDSARLGLTIDDAILQAGLYDGTSFREVAAGDPPTPATGTVYRARLTYVHATSLTCRFGATNGTTAVPSGEIDVQTGSTCLGTTEGVGGGAFFDGGYCRFMITAILSSADLSLLDAYFANTYGAVV